MSTKNLQTFNQQGDNPIRINLVSNGGREILQLMQPDGTPTAGRIYVTADALHEFIEALLAVDDYLRPKGSPYGPREQVITYIDRRGRNRIP